MGVPELPPSHVEDIMAPGMGLQVQQAGDVQEDDVSGLPFRHIVFRIGNNPTSEPLVSANPQFPRWKDHAAVQFTGTMVAFENSVLLAQVYASESILSW